MPVITIMLILKVGNILNLGYEKVLLLYSPQVYSTADVISTYVYREGVVNQNYSFATAVNLFTSVISLILVLGTNKITKKLGQEGILSLIHIFTISSWKSWFVTIRRSPMRQPFR